jgi:hypothetical protein
MTNGEASLRRYRRAHLVVARVLVAAVFLQIGIPFLGIPIVYHRAFGVVIGLLALALALLAVAGRASRSTRRLSSGLPLLVLLQLALIAFSGRLPALATLHGIDAFVILALALVVAIESEEEATRGNAGARSR